MQNQPDKPQSVERKRVSKFSDSIPQSQQLIKDFEDSFGKREPTKFIRGGFMGVSDNNNDPYKMFSNNYEKGQVYDMNNAANLNPYNAIPSPNIGAIPNFISSFNNFNNISINQPITSQHISTPEAKKTESEQSKKSLKGTNLIREIISDNESSLNLIHSAYKDYDKNSNLYLCNLSPFITEEILIREFGIYGKIESIKIIPPKLENIKHFIAFVNFSSASAAEKALLEKQNKLILGQPVKIKFGKKITQTPAIPSLKPGENIQANIVPQQPVLPIIPPQQSPVIQNNASNPVQTPLSQPTFQQSEIANNVNNYNQCFPPFANFQQGFIQNPLPNMNMNFGNNFNNPNINFQAPPNYPYYFYPPNPYAPFPLYNMPPIQVKIPEKEEVKNKIDEEGYITEQQIMLREKLNPDFSFMFQQGSEDNNYYRWRVYSLFQGDSMTEWRTEPFQMLPGGVVWIPPQLVKTEALPKTIIDEETLNQEDDVTEKLSEDSSYAESDEEEKDIANKHNQIGKVPLSSKKRELFNEILTFLNSTKREIKIALIFCYENVKSAEDIINMILDHFKESKNMNKKIVLLYLISDLFFNSSNSNIFNAYCYKKEIESVLPEVFEDLNQLYLSFEGRINAESLKEKISSITKIWRNWQILSDDYFSGLDLTLLKKKKNLDKDNNQYNKQIKSELERYEDELLEIVSENQEELRHIAKSKGISTKGEVFHIVSKLLYLKEQNLLHEYLTKEKKENEKNIANKYKEKICELDLTIQNLKSVLESMQKSYKKIKEAEIDGLPVDVIEYKFMHFEDLDDEIELLYKSKNNVNEETKESTPVPKLKETTEFGVSEIDDDIDGEPI